MKHWQETRDIARRVLEAAASGQFIALATVIEIAGSAYRRPGAKLCVDAHGDTWGGVSGGCLEADVRELGLGSIQSGASCLRHYETGSDEDTLWGLGLGCDGQVRVFIQRIAPESQVLWSKVNELLEGDDAIVLATIVSGDAAARSVLFARGVMIASTTGDGDLDRTLTEHAANLVVSGASRLESLGSSSVFFDVLRPPPRLLVIGAGDDAMPLVAMASDLGFRASVVDHRPAYLSADRFPNATLVPARPENGLAPIRLTADTWAVVMTHTLVRDRAWVSALLDSPVAYIGVLGPRTRVSDLLDELGARAAPRVFGPVGLDIGADGPEQIALAVLAEVLAVRSRRQPQHLRDREVPIHAR